MVEGKYLVRHDMNESSNFVNYKLPHPSKKIMKYKLGICRDIEIKRGLKSK